MTEKFEAWGIVELMGHQRTAGRLSEQMIAGANLLRVDLPQGEGEAFRTMFYGSSAIYAVHITDEPAARAVAAGLGQRPVYAYEIDSHLRKLAAPSRAEATQPEDEDLDDDNVF
jgi:hypothetical protein